MCRANILSVLGLLTKKVNICPDYILSPILSNIYFHELDLFVRECIIKRYKKGIKPIASPSHLRVLSFTYLEKKGRLKQQQQTLRKKGNSVCNINYWRTIAASKYRRVNYLRYLDDTLVGVRGPRILAEKIFKTVLFFLKSNLRLSLDIEKSQILNSFSFKISFLGMLIYNMSTKKLLYRKNRQIENKKLKSLRVLYRLKVLKHKQTRIFKEECLSLLRKSYHKHRNNEIILQKDLISLAENSVIFKNLWNKSNRFIYKEFLKDL